MLKSLSGKAEMVNVALALDASFYPWLASFQFSDPKVGATIWNLVYTINLELAAG